MRLLSAVLICAGYASAGSVSISVVDASGTPLKDVLVILQTLERRDREICRSLTDGQGFACRSEVAPGLYRAIAVTPYGTWRTTLHEFLATPATTRIMLRMTPRGTRETTGEVDYGGDVVNVGARAVNAGGDGISVVDASGAPLKDVLVILQTLDRRREICRSLTDAQGYACQTATVRGPYRAIATTPYAPWNTAVLESLATEPRTRLRLELTVRATHGYGDIESVGNPEADILVLRQNGEPAAKADLLVRDRYATLYLERWYRTDSSGKVRIELVSQPTVVVVIFDGVLVSEEISETDSVRIRLPAPSTL